MSIIEKALDKLGRTQNSATASGGESYANNGQSDVLPAIPEVGYDSFEKPDSIMDKSASIGGEHEGPGKRLSNSVEINLRKLDSLGFITPETDNLHLFEQYRHIKMQVLADEVRGKGGNKGNIIVVTSSVPAEGKTYTSINLALSIAYEYNHTVLFIDGDVHKKSSSKILEINDRPGLLDYLTGDKPDLADLLLTTNIEKFTVLPNGKFHERATELYNSKRMQLLMQELSERYNDRLIIIDTPPLLQDTSASAIARNAGKIILVVEAEKTPRHYVDEALRRVGRDKLLGFILNKSNQRYGNEYGYYSSYGRKSAVAS